MVNKTFYNLCKNVFLGGSLIKHGGQNPLEATRYAVIFYTDQMLEILLKFIVLKKNKISQKINNPKKWLMYLINY